MAPDRISPSSSLLEALRALTLQRAEKQSAAKAGKRPPKQKKDVVTPPHDVEALRLRLSELATHADLTDQLTIQHTRDHAIREILLWEFGANFRTDSQFLPMLDAIGRTIEADPGLQQRFFDLMTELRKS